MFVRYYGAIVFLLLVPVLTYEEGPLAAIGAALVIPAVLVGAEFVFPRWRRESAEPRTLGYRMLPWVYVPLQLAVTAWGIWFAAQSSVGVPAFLSLCIAVGVMAGLFGVLAAHELIHSHSRTEHVLGGAMLLAMSYPHFRIAHIHGHHRHAASLRDPTTARLGEGFYAFVVRSLPEQLRIAIQQGGRSRTVAVQLGSELVLLLATYAAIGVLVGVRGDAFFALQSAVAILALALFDYVAHYGLARGAGEPLSGRHSWNSSHAVSNAVLFNMGRHSDHHRHAVGPYQTLRPLPGGPELPAGYAGSMLLALIPPLWRSVMDRRVAQTKAAPAE